jgi:hypothetical protein
MSSSMRHGRLRANRPGSTDGGYRRLALTDEDAALRESGPAPRTSKRGRASGRSTAVPERRRGAIYGDTGLLVRTAPSAEGLPDGCRPGPDPPPLASPVNQRLDGSRRSPKSPLGDARRLPGRRDSPTAAAMRSVAGCAAARRTAKTRLDMVLACVRNWPNASTRQVSRPRVGRLSRDGARRLQCHTRLSPPAISDPAAGPSTTHRDGARCAAVDAGLGLTLIAREDECPIVLANSSRSGPTHSA